MTALDVADGTEPPGFHGAIRAHDVAALIEQAHDLQQRVYCRFPLVFGLPDTLVRFGVQEVEIFPGVHAGRRNLPGRIAGIRQLFLGVFVSRRHATLSSDQVATKPFRWRRRQVSETT